MYIDVCAGDMCCITGVQQGWIRFAWTRNQASYGKCLEVIDMLTIDYVSFV